MTTPELIAKVGNLQTLRDEVSAISFQNEPERETFRLELIRIADNLLAVNYQVDYTPYTEEEFIMFVQLASDWLEELKNSNAHRLNAAMQKYIVSLIKHWNFRLGTRLVVFTLGDFAMHKVGRNSITNKIEPLLTLAQRTGVQLTYEPVFVLVPDYYKNMALANTPLLHEVGHFVERDNSLAIRVFHQIKHLLEGNNNLRSKFRRDHFPRFLGVNLGNDLRANPEATIILAHIEEFIADIFGAQYAHEYIYTFLKCKEAKHPNADSKDHPSMNRRIFMVTEFLNYCQRGRTSDPLLQAIINVFTPHRPLSLIHSPFTEADYVNGNLPIADEQQMFSLFAAPWKFIIREGKRTHIPLNTEAGYQSLCNLPIYRQIDNNIINAINAFIP